MTGHETIAFIGGGNVTRMLVTGLVAAGVDPDTIRVAEPVAKVRAALHGDFGVRVFAGSPAAVAGADAWILCVKPQLIRGVCEGLAAQTQLARPLVLSVAAGVTTLQLDRWMGGDIAIVRAMPNAAAVLGAGVTGLYANPQVDAAGCRRAERLMWASGETVWVTDEEKMDAVTAVSGSGPAYAFLLAEAMIDAALAEGLSDDVARSLVAQTLLGAARMMTEEVATPVELRRRVTSPDGTTQAAVEVLLDGGFQDLVARAIHAARIRGRQLSTDLD
ncbi:pyrroline-5-carboxylate reductase [Cognatiluteimonas profundi]|uniref:pyrroline-5-carboxylate reductase n=1 Tax=Cognatiluteimonas profundi TaxID=2594501 RepID=UPI00131A9BB9|nr:pyrroline-5-carboxylate reductase [Lysobacter profundi]